ncbi:MAG: DUF6497 family protein [Albidovulum sp.]
MTVFVRIAGGARENGPKPTSDLTVPSGQVVTLIDTVQTAPGPEGLTLRFRFLAPGIARVGGTISAEAAQADMAHLCTHYALPRVSQSGPAIQQVVISLSDRAVPFGDADPEATQYFEAYSIADGTCIWEAF